MSTAAPDVDAAFEASLMADAGLGEPAEVPAPPRQERDPKAPFGRADDGSPIAPHGMKADGTPRLHSAGPGRPKADAPRVTTQTAAPSAPGAGAKGAAANGTDYSGDLMALGQSVWVGASSLKGGRLLGFPLPDARPYAAVFRASLPQQVAAWNAAAQQNPTVRGYVEKLSGEGSWSWMIGVAVATAGLAAGFAEVSRLSAEDRAKWAAYNDAEMTKFINAQVEAMGLEVAA
jgi:hypothetical protein